MTESGFFEPDVGAARDCRAHPSPFGPALAGFREGVLDVLRSIEITVHSTFHSIDEAEPPANCTKVDLISIRAFFEDWVLKPDFQTAAFAPELAKHLGRLGELVTTSHELYGKNKPEIEKIKSLESYFQSVRALQDAALAELDAAERQPAAPDALPPFDALFQKPLKFLDKMAQIAAQLEQFPLLYAINGRNVDAWVAAGLSSRRPFKNVSDATAQLIDHFLDLESDLEEFKDADFAARSQALVG